MNKEELILNICSNKTKIKMYSSFSEFYKEIRNTVKTYCEKETVESINTSNREHNSCKFKNIYSLSNNVESMDNFIIKLIIWIQERLKLNKLKSFNLNNKYHERICRITNCNCPIFFNCASNNCFSIRNYRQGKTRIILPVLNLLRLSS